ncbi:MAG: hypothetical protein UY77_C0028G0001 [Candidatus Uhrbacteria bacterium GW2011_GWA2_53_10]|uniref:DNA-binding protein HU n=1 Tax=Candidatus Uhrbacteria bacterium GW2011_GWA2_53_10 TaxID=1618980 RepID=A0A0G1XLZ2_9BACT|nr:MAG: hypothetical protein UY77_C0028G0001 [Candidatus Uhrbacteria bacterium GW2011_GWA2_53_10]
MNKAELASRLAEKLSVSKKVGEDFIAEFEEIVTNELKAGGEVTIAGFGTFSARVRAGRLGVNPQKPTEKIQIPSVTVPKFKAGKALKDALKGKGGGSAPPPAPAAAA